MKKVLCISNDPNTIQLVDLVITKNIENVQYFGMPSDNEQVLQKALEFQPNILIVFSGLPSVPDKTIQNHWLLIDRIRHELSPHSLGVIADYQDLMAYDIDPPHDIPFGWAESPLNKLIKKPFSVEGFVNKVHILLENLSP